MTSSNSISDNNSSIIKHPKLPLVILRTDYLAIARGNYCAAKLLAVLENWTNWFVRQAKPERWVKLTSEAIHKHLLAEHNTKQIRKALKSLVALGFIRQEKRRASRNDQSYFYWFDIERIQAAIDALEPPSEPESEADYLRMDASIDASTSVIGDPAQPVRSLVTLSLPIPDSHHHTTTNEAAPESAQTLVVVDLAKSSSQQFQKVTTDVAHSTPTTNRATTISPETRVILDVVDLSTSNGAIATNAVLSPHGATNSAQKLAENRVVVDPAKSTTSNRPNRPHGSGKIDHIDAAQSTTSLNRYLNNQNKSSSIDARAREPGEEDFEFGRKAEEESDQGIPSRSEGTSGLEITNEREGTSDLEITNKPENTSTPETTNEPEDTSAPEQTNEKQPISTFTSRTPLIDNPKTNDKPKNLDWIDYSGGRGIAKSPSSDEIEGEAALLKWVVEVKIPSLDLEDPPRNPEAYAKAMIWRDGDALRKEHGGLVRDRLSREEGRALGKLVHAKAGDWREAGISLGVSYDASGIPHVRLGDDKITATEFLEMVMPDPAQIHKSVEFNPEDIAVRKERQRRLRCADVPGETPPIAFLEECWSDVFLRPAIKKLIDKYPRWGIIVNSVGQLQSWFD